MEKITSIEARIKGVPELIELGESKTEQIVSVFAPIVAQLREFEAPYTKIVEIANESGVTPDIAAQAKRLRLDIRKIRVATDKARREQKAFYLNAGRAIDGVANLFIQDTEKLANQKKYTDVAVLIDKIINHINTKR